MSENYDLLFELYSKTVSEITTPLQWQQFLKTAAFNYKQDFYNQVLIFAQKPNATVLMSENDWMSKYERSVHQEQAVCLMSALDNNVKSVFDISDTLTENQDKTIPIFTFDSSEEHINETLKAVNSTYELSENSVENAVYSAADGVTADKLEVVFDELKSAVVDTPAAHFSTPLLHNKISRLIANSAAYMCLVRCGYSVDEIFSKADFRDVSTFGLKGIISIGTVMSRVSFELMRTIIKANQKINKKMYENLNRTFATQNEKDYNIDTINERQVSDNGTQLLRTEKTRLYQGASADTLHENGNTRNASGIPDETSGGSRTAVAELDRTESGGMEADGTTQGRKPGGMDRLDDKSPRNNERKSSDRADLQLNKSKAAEITNSLPLFLSQEQVDNIILNGSEFADSKFRIFEQFAKKEPLKNNITFLKNEYGIGGTNGPNMLDIWHNAKGITITSIDRKEKYILTWKAIAKRIEQLIAVNRYLSAAVIFLLSIVILVVVYGRFFKIFLLSAIAPIPLAGFASEATESLGMNFMKAYIGECMRGVIILVACMIFSAFAVSPTGLDASTPGGMTWVYIGEVIMQMLLLVIVVKGSDRLVKEIFGF